MCHELPKRTLRISYFVRDITVERIAKKGVCGVYGMEDYTPVGAKAVINRIKKIKAFRMRQVLDNVKEYNYIRSECS